MTQTQTSERHSARAAAPHGFSMPAEWCMHQAVWLAWPSHENLWQEALAEAQNEFVALCEAIARPLGAQGARGETVNVLTRSDADAEVARERMPFAVIHRGQYGDIWLRDTAPIFLADSAGALVAACYRFNGWGNKYDLPGDRELAAHVAKLSQVRAFSVPLVLEGGAIEVDAQGTVLTTEQCLLNPNRNPDLTRDQIERAVLESLRAEKMIWIREGLKNDHTDGHIDTIARFVENGVVVCMEAQTQTDPNRDVLLSIRKELAAMRDSQEQKLEVVTVPSPGLIEDEDGELMPASHVNYYVGNESVVVPLYQTRNDDKVIYTFEAIFRTRKVIGASARTILAGGGAFHCITQQMPL